jgi:chaperone modulatory protein CbpM
MKLPLRRKIEEVSQISGLADEIIIQFINEEWIHPIDIETRMFDEEDLSRILLIHDLRERFGVNDEAVPVILHLIDQLNFIINNNDEN